MGRHAGERKRRAKRKPVVPTSAQQRARPLPLKQERAVAAYVGPAKGVKAEAMRAAGYSESTATDQQARLFHQPKVERRIEELLVDKGLSDERVVAKHAELLEAKTTKYYQAQSLGDHTDNDTQLKAVELVYRLRGKLKDRVEIESVTTHWAERIALVIEKCACPKCKAVLLDAIIGELSAPTAG